LLLTGSDDTLCNAWSVRAVSVATLRSDVCIFASASERS
jgi:hypothetical protein